MSPRKRTCTVCCETATTEWLSSICRRGVCTPWWVARCERHPHRQVDVSRPISIDGDWRDASEGASGLLPVAIYGNHLPPDAPAALQVDAGTIAKMYSREEIEAILLRVEGGSLL